MSGVSCQFSSSPVLNAASLIFHLYISYTGANGVNVPNTKKHTLIIRQALKNGGTISYLMSVAQSGKDKL